jgi:hypothetical protein
MVTHKVPTCPVIVHESLNEYFPDSGLKEEIQNICYLDLRALFHFFYLRDYVKQLVLRVNISDTSCGTKNQIPNCNCKGKVK